jgi:CubicO group peptidase (beta-lactamase class C family)
MIVLVAAVPLGAGAATSKAPGAPAPFVSSLPPPADIQRIVDDRVITYHDTVGLIVGVIDPTGRAFYARGPARVGNDDPVDGNTIFEIGAVTKTFTGLLLTDMAHRGQLALSDPAEKYTPGVPRHGAKPITLLDLATHTSGLPRMPPNTAASDLNNPNADLSVQQFLDSLARYELTRDAGQGYEYSNAGYDLLGLIEEKAGGAAFGELLKSRVLTPLRMDHTWFGTPAADKDLLANGYDAHLRPAPRSDPPTLPGADGMRSTANDLLDLLGAALGLTTTPLAPALADMVRTERPTQYAELKAAIGWHVANLHGVEMIWENGQTAGFRAFIGYAPKARAGVVVLSNAANTIDDIGAHILDKDTPLRILHREVAINPAELANYLGVYQVSETFDLTVSRDADRLFIQGTTQPRAELFAEGDGKFFLRAANAEIIFKTDSSGRADSLELTQDGKTAAALRVR